MNALPTDGEQSPPGRDPLAGDALGELAEQGGSQWDRSDVAAALERAHSQDLAGVALYKIPVL